MSTECEPLPEPGSPRVRFFPTRALMALLGITLIALGLIIPLSWLTPGGLEPGVVPSLDGARLFRAGLLVEGFAICILAAVGARYSQSGETVLPRTALWVDGGSCSQTRATILLLLVTCIGLALRLAGLNGGLWLDEISPVVRYGHLPVFQVLSTYLGSDNHLLNTLMVNGSMRVFGSSAWAIRLPAALFGASTVPLLYIAGRFFFTRWLSLGAALLLALSYHHIFFSQNARGYSAYLFFCLAGTIFLSLALCEDRFRDWVSYCASMFLAASALLNSVFVIAAHGLLGLCAVGSAMRRGGNPGPMLRRLLAIFSVLGVLIFQLYVPVIPQIQGVMGKVYVMKSAGNSPLSSEFLSDLLRGLSPVLFIGATIVVPFFLALLAFGTWLLYKRNWLVVCALLLPNALFGFFVIFKALAVTPRMFLLMLFPALLAGMAAGEFISGWLARRLGRESLGPAFLGAFVGILALASASALPRYYALPKQDYAGAVHQLASERHPGDIVIVVYLAEQGYKFYAEPADPDCYYVRDPALFRQIVADHPGRQIWLVSTFERALRLDLPEIAEEMKSGWEIDHRFRGAIGDGDVLIYRRNSSP